MGLKIGQVCTLILIGGNQLLCQHLPIGLSDKPFVFKPLKDERLKTPTHIRLMLGYRNADNIRFTLFKILVHTGGCGLSNTGTAVCITSGTASIVAGGSMIFSVSVPTPGATSLFFLASSTYAATCPTNLSLVYSEAIKE